MAKNIYVGVEGKARKAKSLYVGINGKARKVKKVYVGVEGKTRLAWEAEGGAAQELPESFAFRLTVDFALRDGRTEEVSVELAAQRNAEGYGAIGGLASPAMAMNTGTCTVSGVPEAVWNALPYVALSSSGGSALYLERSESGAYSGSSIGFFALYGNTTTFGAAFAAQAPSGSGPS